MIPRPILASSLAVSVCAALVFSGCGKPREPVPFGGSASKPATAPAPAPKPAAKPAASEPAPAAVPEPKADGGASLQQYGRNLAAAPTVAAKTIDTAMLNRAVQQFGSMEGRLPANLEELVTMKYLGELPKAPPGYRLNYDAASGQVTVVKTAP